MNPEFARALRAAMNIQVLMLELHALGIGKSGLNAKITLQQMKDDHEAIGAFLNGVERLWAAHL